MNQRIGTRLAAVYASILLLTACGSNGGGGGSAQSSCVSPSGIQTSFRQVLAQAPAQAGKKHLILKMSDLPNDFVNFKNDLQAEYSASLSALKVVKISADSVAIDLPASSPDSKVIERYVADQKINFMEPDYQTFSLQTAESIESTAQDNENPQSLGSIMTPAMKAQAAAGKEIVVAVIDTGVDFTHKDLAPYMWHNPKEIPNNGIDDDGNGLVDDVYGWDFANNDNNPMSDDAPSYHGTHVAGIVKQAALLAEQGIKVKIMALKYLDASASGRTSVAIQAIDYAIQNGATILNNSWGSFAYSTALSDAIERARRANVLFVAAAGNGDSSGNGVNIDQTPFYPAAYPHDNIVSVAAVDSKGVLAQWSNFGATRVDIAGPGVGIVSTRNGNTYGTLSGTSMATPYVSGVAAMIWSMRPDLSFNEIRRVLSQSSVATPSLRGKVVTNAMVSRNQALQIGVNYIHNPNDKSTPDMTPNETCAP